MLSPSTINVKFEELGDLLVVEVVSISITHKTLPDATSLCDIIKSCQMECDDMTDSRGMFHFMQAAGGSIV